MTRRGFRVLLASLGLAGAGALVVWAEEHGEGEEGEQTITLDQVPAKARDALKKLAGGAKIEEIEKEAEHDAVVYEAMWTVDGNEHEAVVTADGVLVELEEKVAVSAAPEAVKKGIAKVFKETKDIQIEKKTQIVYEVKGTVDGKAIEVKFDAKGTPMMRAHKEKDKEEGEDEDEGEEEGEDEDEGDEDEQEEGDE